VNTIQIFTNPDDCIDNLTNFPDEKIFLIISGTFGQHIIPLIHDILQINLIYVFSGANKSKYEAWAKEYNKVKGVFTEIELICESLKQDVYQLNQDAIPISFVSLSASPSNVQLDQLDSSFMYTQLLKEIIFDMQYDQTAFKEFVNYCREVFVGNDHVLKDIDQFERNYYSQSAIWWYTHHMFLYPMMNRALRLPDIEIIVRMGFFIHDLHQHIQQLHTKQFGEHNAQPFTVYRGQGLSQTDFEQLIETRGGLMSFNNFLSTSRDREVSFIFAESNQDNPDLVGILFKITIDPSISSTPFAAVSDISMWHEEDEVLFSMHAIFRIGEIRQIRNNSRLWQVELILTSDNDQQLQALTERMRHDIQGTGFQRLGALMLELGQYDKALEVYETLLSATHSNADRQALSSVHNQLGAIYNLQGEIDKALVHYNTSLEIKLTYLSPNDPSLSPVYSNIGSALRNQNKLNEALEYMERALNIELQAAQSDPLKIASYHNNIGLILTDQSEYYNALVHYEKALEIQQKYLPPNHPDLATSYNNIGAIYDELQEYSKALSFYEKSLNIMRRSLPFDHPKFATSYNNISTVYNEMGEYSKALSYYEKALEILLKSLPPNHPNLATSYGNIGTVYNEMGEYSKALSYYEKAIDICHRTFAPDHPQLTTFKKTLDIIRKKL
jgi:tetratricopeptide (TPR) repeat protein